MRLSLSHTCLLDASGELGRKAQADLHEHVAKFPAALLEYELARSQLDFLRSLPKPVAALDDAARKQLSDAIKQGLQRKLRVQENEARARRRWKFAYRALAGLTGVAACLVITAGVMAVNAETQRRDIAQAHRALEDYARLDAPNTTDDQFARVSDQLSTLEDAQSALAASPNTVPPSFANLLNLNTDSPAQPLRDPGSL